ncbi:MAG: hypothetical protein HN726_02435 [Candidatus Magasanikbacteria bacterium]|jgi:hypothetical protein|nr:hypothetical protein [Candidatus Magasanikbacteria bacterium]MBT4221428.1 hypothetical protein [Candidatus Magasanikbacteria bacterium]MBT4350724.1 hypothetical protein [Candidatus Magasanikbacteria bacterium]MBT4541600.1 hypothetical protein [Candidatus Magasanikbacteria bacterium]MBT6252957.1 hypothetical protein [Candidatus Magasanikbacteria bacterium]
MKLSRTLAFGVMLWISIFVLYSILLSLPFLGGRDVLLHVVFWILLIPIVIGLTKWYFKAGEPRISRGLVLGLSSIVIGVLLDVLITVPFFLVPQTQGGTFADGALLLFGDWKLYIGFVEVILLCLWAGFEFDKTFSRAK